MTNSTKKFTTSSVTHPAFAMLYLCGCVLANETPDTARFSELKLKELYEISRFHSLTALVCEGLKRSDFSPSEDEQEYMTAFQREREKSVRKNLMLDTERAKLVAFMEQHGIWYMPLKGVVLKTMYPQIGLRQMADNDILFDETFRKNVRDWFAEQGYEVKAYGQGNHDVYLKKPVYNYEMHTALYGASHRPEWQAYYKGVKERLVKDETSTYGYHFTDEDFYIYFITHGFKHFDGSGNGVRFLLDLYVYLTANQTTLDFVYIKKELKKLGVAEFEKNCRELVSDLFSDIHSFDFETLSNEKREQLLYFLSSGTYGTTAQRIEKGISRHGKIKYLLLRLFPGTEVLRGYHPIFRYRGLIVFGWVYRGCKIMTSRSDKVMKELREIFRSKGKRS